MIGVTIAIGEKWQAVAKRAADRMSEMTGLDCRIIDDWHGEELEHPAWLKCRILDIFKQENEFFYFDSDVWAMKPWHPDHIFHGCNRDFIGVHAWENWILQGECNKYGLPPHGFYIGGGLLVFGREHKAIWDYALSLHPGFSAWFDQTPLNLSLKRLACPVTRLPYKYCAEAHGGIYDAKSTNCPFDEVVNLHFCSCGGRAEQVESLQKGMMQSC